MIDFEKLTQVVGELDEETMIEMLNQVMTEDEQQAAKAMEACQKGMNIVGDLFETKEYFVSDLIFAGEMMTTAVSVLRPALTKGDGNNTGKMILCTVENDLHDIGKNIVKAMLEASGFEVIDLGIDVPADKVVETARNENIRIIGLSGVLTLAVDSMKKTVEAIRKSGLDAKVIIGGCPVNEEVRQLTGADAWAFNPQDTVKICKGWALEGRA